MSGLRVDAVVLQGDDAELIRYPADEIWLRAVGHGDIQIAEYRSEDRGGPPSHSQPWDEAQIVVKARLSSGSETAIGFALVPARCSSFLRRSACHSGPGGQRSNHSGLDRTAHDVFARDMCLMAAGASLDEIAEVVGQHGVRLA
jgi:hypothetical protein